MAKIYVVVIPLQMPVRLGIRCLPVTKEVQLIITGKHCKFLVTVASQGG